MSFLYVTADRIGTPTGGGVVTYHERLALDEFAKPEVENITTISRDGLGDCQDPWGYDEKASQFEFLHQHKLAHFYSGTFGKTVANLKRNGCKICYTIAAHDRFISREEHEALGLPFPYTHLTDESLWQRYIEGYRQADVIICPGKHAADIVRSYGPDFQNKRIEIIPHGCETPKKIAPFPKRFTVGYMGSMGPDKGVRYLLDAWRRKEGFLKIAGRDTTSPWAHELVNRFGAGNVWLAGWQENISDFYNSISLYIQPSATEGFGIEVIEALAHGRPVLCSENAGAADLVPEWCRFKARDSKSLSAKIDEAQEWMMSGKWREDWIGIAEANTWDKIRERYKDVWRSLLV